MEENTQNRFLTFVIPNAVVALVINVITGLLFSAYLAPSPLHYCYKIPKNETGEIIFGGLTPGSVQCGVGALAVHLVISILIWLILYGIYAKGLDLTNKKPSYFLGFLAGLPAWMIGFILFYFAKEGLLIF